MNTYHKQLHEFSSKHTTIDRKVRHRLPSQNYQQIKRRCIECAKTYGKFYHLSRFYHDTNDKVNYIFDLLIFSFYLEDLKPCQKLSRMSFQPSVKLYTLASPKRAGHKNERNSPAELNSLGTAQVKWSHQMDSAKSLPYANSSTLIRSGQGFAHATPCTSQYRICVSSLQNRFAFVILSAPNNHSPIC